MPLYEYLCPVCNDIEEKLEFGSEVDQPHVCFKCGAIKQRLISKCRFELIYNNATDMCSWGSEGYASSQYWNEYKAAKARGENVKPAGVD